jgi:alkanesulfonate monooxygenase SsuD/methylene tetrahydromethanopterin reductase-like flavin-dependent oxidoreductase (luciferase family)
VTKSHFGVDIDKPVAHLRETVAAVRHVMTHAHEGPTPFRGEYFDADFAGLDPAPPPVRPHVPIWLGALRGRMTRLAGEIGDGIIGHPLWGIDHWLTRVREDLEAGAGRAGRNAAEIHRCVYLTVAISNEPGEALADARQSLAAYAAVAQYAPFFEDRGFGAAAGRIRSLWEAGDRERAAREVTEEMARAFLVLGTADEARTEVARAGEIADSLVIAPPSWGVPMQRVGFYTQQIDRTFFAG